MGLFCFCFHLVGIESDLHGEDLLHDGHGLLLAERVVLGAVLAKEFPEVDKWISWSCTG